MKRRKGGRSVHPSPQCHDGFFGVCLWLLLQIEILGWMGRDISESTSKLPQSGLHPGGAKFIFPWKKVNAQNPEERKTAPPPGKGWSGSLVRFIHGV